jgi:hypothetical protein
MILIENRHFLLNHYRSIIKKLSLQNIGNKELLTEIEESKNGSKTIKITKDGKTQYLHSKYNPEAESQNFLKYLHDLENYDHIFFFGIGLGYHIKAILEKFPHLKFTICEPNLEILSHFLENVNLNDLPTNQLEGIIISSDENELKSHITNLNRTLKSSTYVCSIPLYENLYTKLLEVVMHSFKEILNSKRSEIAVNVAFQKRWTVNSIMNFRYLLKTPNILHDIDKDLFKGKPAIIVAAGPSLEEEFDNLRFIKKNNLAYIFSVGSAINSLIEQDIYPDAVCTYDPHEVNQIVIKKLKDKPSSNTPLIFGSSVGFETIQDYPGPLLHMIISQDTVAPRFLDTSKEIDIILDAPSIAVITFQLLVLLGFDTITLVGQNLSYKKNKLYASGIDYSHVNNELTEEDTKNLISILDVNGKEVHSNETFILMKKQLELHINSSNIRVFNTTKDGAHIEGTTFMPLSDVIKNTLTVKQIVPPLWYEGECGYDIEFSKSQLDIMELSKNKYETQLKKVLLDLKHIETLVQKHQISQLENSFAKFDKEFARLKENLFYQTFIEPMVRVQNKILSDETQKIRYEKNLKIKAESVVQTFGTFLIYCKTYFQFVLPYYIELYDEIQKMYNEDRLLKL